VSKAADCVVPLSSKKKKKERKENPKAEVHLFTFSCEHFVTYKFFMWAWIRFVLISTVISVNLLVLSTNMDRWVHALV